MVAAGLGFSLLVSYAQARGETVAVSGSGGLMQRAERLTLQILGCLFDPVLSRALGKPEGTVLFWILVRDGGGGVRDGRAPDGLDCAEVEGRQHREHRGSQGAEPRRRESKLDVPLRGAVGSTRERTPRTDGLPGGALRRAPGPLGWCIILASS